MTPYESYMAKQALFGALAGAANTIAQIPQFAEGIGGAAKMVGKLMGTKAKPSGLYSMGKSLETHGTKLNEGLNTVLNQGMALHRYDPTQWNPGVRHAANFIGMNTTSAHQVMTPQRALVWAGGGMGVYHGVKGLSDLASSSRAAPVAREMPSYSMVDATRPQS